VTDREDPDEPSFAIDFIDEAKSSHLVFPEAAQLAEERLAGEWV
jgi:hypothetical protein